MPRSNKMQRNIRNQQIGQDKHLRVSGNSTDSERSETSNRTINSGSSYSEVQYMQHRDGQERLQNIEEFNEFPTDYDEDTEDNENVHGTEGLCLSNRSGGSNSTHQSGSSYGDVHGIQNRDGQERLQNREEFNELPIDYNDNIDENEASGIQHLSYCPRGPRWNPGPCRIQPIHEPLSPLNLQQQNVRETDRVMLHYDKRQCAHYDNSRSRYHGRSQYAQYDNAPSVHGTGGLRFSNQSGGSNTTSYYADVGPWSTSTTSRDQPPPLPSARTTYCVLEPDLNLRDTESEPKHKSCSMKRVCQCGLWTAIFLGISIGVALSTLNNMTTSDLEKQIIEGNNQINNSLASSLKTLNETILSVQNDSHTLWNDTSNLRNKTETSIQELRTMSLELSEELKVFNDSFNEEIMFVKNDSQTLRNEISNLKNETETSIRELKTMPLKVFEKLQMFEDFFNDTTESVGNDSQKLRIETSNLRNETETSIQELKTMLLELFEEFKRNMTAYCTNQTGNQDTGSVSDSGGQCYNSTANGCVDQCNNMCDGDYQSCRTCKGYVTCANRILWQRNCSVSHLVWDDNTKRCESVSSTC